MDTQIIQIANRIKELREVLEISRTAMAEELNISLSEYDAFESAQKDIPISTIFAIANILDVDYSVLLTGDSPKMDAYTVVRKGEGVSVDRYEGYRFESLCSNFKNKIMEPMIVTLEPGDTPPKLVMHDGQELNYCLEGSVKVTVGKNEFVLREGDSIYFNPKIPHGQQAVGAKTKFLTVITG